MDSYIEVRIQVPEIVGSAAQDAQLALVWDAGWQFHERRTPLSMIV